MKTIILILLVSGLQVMAKEPHIQVALLLDTSSSMDGLLEQAKTRLWHVVNEMARARKSGQTARLQVALYEFGKSTISADEGHLRMLVPLTDNLDLVSEELFSLATNGGDEFCGLAIDNAMTGLAWSADPGDYKAIFIAGNEAFSQGPKDFRAACSAAIAKGIVVNTIFCGAKEEGIRLSWKDGADLADGAYMSIDQNEAVAAIQAPQDGEILALGNRLNSTYVGYGKAGAAAGARQATQDIKLEKKSKEAAVQRSMAKASPAYRTESWDLVSATVANDEVLAEMEEEDLTGEMKDMNTAERKQYISGKQKERKKIQDQIEVLRQARKKYVAHQRRDSKSLDSAMINAVQTQLKARRFDLSK